MPIKVQMAVLRMFTSLSLSLSLSRGLLPRSHHATQQAIYEILPS